MRWYHVVLGCSFLNGLLNCGVDWDHIWRWVLHVRPPLILQGLVFTIVSEGRPFHTVPVFLLYAFVFSFVATALITRRFKPDTIDRRLDA